MQVRASLLGFVCSIVVGCIYSLPAHAATTSVTVTPASPTIIGRITRNGVASSCAVTPAKPFPGTSGGTFGYAVSAPVTNTSGAAICAVVTLTTSAACATEVFATAYSGSFNPASLSTNYLGDGGASSATSSFSIGVPAGGSVVIMVSYTTQTPADTCTVTADIGPAPTAPAPLGLPLLALLGIGFVGVGWFALRRRAR